MRVLIVVHGYPPTHSAGGERRAERQARWFANRGHAVAVVAVERVDAAADARTERQDGVEVTRLCLNLQAAQPPFVGLYDHPAIKPVIRRRIADHRPDLVHVVGGYLVGRPAVGAAREAGVPVVLTLTEYYFLCWRLNLIRSTGRLCSGPDTVEKCVQCWFEQERRYRWPAMLAPGAMEWYWSLANRRPSFSHMASLMAGRRDALRETLEWADAVISPSRLLPQVFTRYGISVERFTFMRQGVCLPVPLPARSPGKPGELRLGYLGQLKPHKGVDLVVAAARRLIREGLPVSLDIWGAEHEESDYVRRLRHQSVRFPQVRWNGQYGEATSCEVLAGIDALVVPSRWPENSPNVVLESFAMGVPVVSTNLGGMAELVEEGAGGLLFELGNLEDLCRHLRRLAKEPGLLARLSATVPPVKTLDQEMQELMELYQRVAGRSDGGASRDGDGPRCTAAS